MTWLLGLLGIGALVAFLLRESPPYRNPLPDPGALSRMLRILLTRGVHKGNIKGTLTVCVRDDEERRLVFVKDIKDTGDVGFRAEFPFAGWSEQYYGPFREELARRGVPHREVATEGRRALTFDFGRDFGGAYVVARVLFEEVMGLRLDRDCVAYFRDTLVVNAPHLTGVDAPDDGWG